MIWKCTSSELVTYLLSVQNTSLIRTDLNNSFLVFLLKCNPILRYYEGGNLRQLWVLWALEVNDMTQSYHDEASITELFWVYKHTEREAREFTRTHAHTVFVAMDVLCCLRTLPARGPPDVDPGILQSHKPIETCALF